MNLVKENSNGSYDFGCVMLYFNFPQMDSIHSLINVEDIYEDEDNKSFGLEDEPHVTLLYGLHDEVTNNQVIKVLSNFKYSNCIIHNPSLFNSEKYDVLKFDVSNSNFHSINKELKKYPHTSNFPDYHPHLTIGYIKKGKGQKYVDIIKEKMGKNGYNLIPKYAVYSKPDGIKTKIKVI